MSFFVIAHKEKEFLDSPVFRAGKEGKQEAVAVFTERSLAEKYVADADWNEQFEVGALQPIQLLKWLVAAHQEGCGLVAVDPDRAAHLAGREQHVVQLDEPLNAFAVSLQTLLEKTANAGTSADR